MRATAFEESNREYAANQPEYETLPCYRHSKDRGGRVVVCWQLTWKELLQVLWTGQIWQQTLTFGKPLQPVMLTADKPEMKDDNATY